MRARLLFAVINFRKSLLHLVLLREEDYVYDEKLADVTAIIRAGDENALSNIGLWSQFLAPSPAILNSQQHATRAQDVVVPAYNNVPAPH